MSDKDKTISESALKRAFDSWFRHEVSSNQFACQQGWDRLMDSVRAEERALDRWKERHPTPPGSEKQ